MRASIVLVSSRGLSATSVRRLEVIAGRDDVELILAGTRSGVEAPPRLVARVVAAGASPPEARNRGAEAARAPWILFLDDDVVPDAGALEAMLDETRHAGADAFTGLLLHPDRSVNQAGVAFGPDAEPIPLYRGLPEEHRAVVRPRDLQAACASFLLVSRIAFERAGGFDPELGDGFSDLDLTLRLAAEGNPIRLRPTAIATRIRPDGPWDDRSGARARFQGKWRGRVAADDLEHYRRDGLLRIDYEEGFPPRLDVAPELARVDSRERESDAERLLGERAKQFAASLEDRLSLEAEIDRLRRGVAGLSAKDTSSAGIRLTRVHEGLRRVRSHLATGRVISIVLPVRDAGLALRRSLPKLLEQEIDDTLEIVAVDYGSRDDSCDALRHHGASVLAASAGRLDAAMARHLAAREARGEFVITVEPTTEPEPGWLRTLVAALDRNPDLAAVWSTLRFRVGEDPLARRGADSGGPPLLTAAFTLAKRAADARDVPDEVTRFHLSGTAFRASALARAPLSPLSAWTGPAWALEARLAGWAVAEESAAIVGEAVPGALPLLLLGGAEIGSGVRSLFRGTFATADLLPAVFQWVREDWEWLRSRSGLTAPEVESWRVWAALRRSAEIVGYWMGVNETALPPGFVENLSLAVLADEPPEAIADTLRFL